MPDSHTSAAPTGHGHGHGHGHPVGAASRRVRRLLTWTLVPFALAALAGVLLLYPFERQAPADPGSEQARRPVDGVVLSATTSACTSGTSTSGGSGCLRLRVRLQDGPAAGKVVEQLVPAVATSPEFTAGDAVVLAYTGADPAKSNSYRIVDFQRGGWLVVLAGLFAASVLVLGRRQGLKSLLALGVSFAVLAGFVFPAVLAGRDPLAVAVVGAGVIMFAVLYLTHGVSARTSTAVLGTLLSLGLIGVLSALFSALTRLTGLTETSSQLIAALGSDIDTRGLLLAGVVIGALGVLDDVTVTQTSAVWELRNADPAMGWRELYSAGLRIGRDHVSSAVNTLVLAYAGAALPLLLLYTLSGRGFGDIVTAQPIAQEVVRTLVGSIGLIAAVPITTAIAATVALRDSQRPQQAQRPETDSGGIAAVVRAAATRSAECAVLRTESDHERRWTPRGRQHAPGVTPHRR